MTELRPMFVHLSLDSDGGLKVVGATRCGFKASDPYRVYSSPYVTHPGGGKMYHDLRGIYWWSGLEREVADFVGSEVYFKVLEEFAKRLWDRSLLPTKVDEKHVVRPDLVSKTKKKVKLICERLKAATGREKSYANLNRRDIEFQVGNKVFLKLSPWKEVLRFDRKGTLSPRYVEQIHDIFHVSMLWKYHSDPSHIVPVEEIEVQPNLTFDEEPIEILDHEVKVLQNMRVSLIKVLWCNHKME
ncbi:uncharacterized protein LOC108477594 [Gossypium arboreum]|uniref:uncharacterized protein LOC108477594 n=1 Tax=Gossypium arboreum TaxID=29729 RepID=UPI000818FB14|nr:uncharacterized protein LOC108477594 [Gossypium arboreum]